jgi:2-succinyl-6-hydroxy-2,4-cyclohexadiene-1-carboxylate synthase
VTILALHGFTGGPASWEDVLPDGALAATLVGHGPAAPSTMTDWSTEIDRLAALVASRSPDGEGWHLAGYSMGARVALGLLARHPSLFTRATLISARPALPDHERMARRADDARWIALLEHQGIVTFVDAWEAQPLFATQRRLPRALQARRRAERLAHDPATLAVALRVLGLAETHAPAHTLSSLGIPITLLAGADDPRFIAHAEDLARTLPRVTVRVVPDAGHDLLLEAPRAVHAALTLETPP